MAKLNLTAVLNQFAAEKFETVSAAKAAHPYYGLKDSMGWLTRYPAPSQESDSFIDKEWVRSFVANGGNFDSNGHRGLCPYNSSYSPTKVEEICPVQYGRWVKLTGRGDDCFGQTYWSVYSSRYEYATSLFTVCNNVPSFLAQFSISETCDAKSLAIAFRGHLISLLFAECGIECKLSFLTLGRWSQSKVDSLVLAKGVPASAEVWSSFANGLARAEKVELGMTLSPALQYALKCGLNRVGRRKQDNEIHHNSVVERKRQPRNTAAANLLLKHGAGRFSQNWLVNSSHIIITNAGSCHEFRDGSVAICRGAKCTTFDTVVTDGIATATVIGWGNNLYHFAWIISAGFKASHMESTDSVQDALRKLAKRKNIHSGLISLNDVRNDKSGTLGYCITGSKSFLRKAMPHIYNLISEYHNWSDVPADIMSIEWNLHDPKGLFAGSSRNPFTGSADSDYDDL